MPKSPSSISTAPGLPRELLESELFGHEKGAFTGAVTSRTGLIRAAHRGTLFLDEIGDMDLALQPKLLKVLEEQRVPAAGRHATDRRVDIRLIAATHQDLEERSPQAFRCDLYFRISTIPLSVPSLRDRPEDIPALARASSATSAPSLAGRPRLTRDADAAAEAYAWPGNIRELRNVLERAVLLGDRPVIDRDDLGLSRASAAPTAPVAAGSAG